jgi:hypothetical protein
VLPSLSTADARILARSCNNEKGRLAAARATNRPINFYGPSLSPNIS